jgi:hypothetical protein
MDVLAPQLPLFLCARRAARRQCSEEQVAIQVAAVQQLAAAVAQSARPRKRVAPRRHIACLGCGGGGGCAAAVRAAVVAAARGAQRAAKRGAGGVCHRTRDTTGEVLRRLASHRSRERNAEHSRRLEGELAREAVALVMGKRAGRTGVDSSRRVS